MNKPKPHHSNVRQQILIILSGFILVIVIVASAAKIGLGSMQENKQRLEEIVNSNNLKFKLLTIMSDAIRERMLIVYDITNTQDPFELDDLNLLSGQKVRDFIRAREQLTALGLNQDQLQQLEEQKKQLSKAQSILNKIIDQAINDEEITGISQIKQARAANGLVLQSLLNMQNSQNQHAHKQLQLVEKLSKQTSRQVLSLAFFAFMASALVVFIIIKHMLKQGVALNQALTELHDVNQMLERRVEQRTAELMSTKEDNMRMSAELDAGRKLQHIILPQSSELKQFPSLDIAAYMQAAEEVGGDYYDILNVNDTLYMGIGDVTGHGLESGILMLMTQAAVRSQLQQQADIENVLQQVNRTLYDNVQRMHSDKHLTLALCSYHYQQSCGYLQFCGQHESIIVVRNDGGLEEYDTDSLGFPVGLVDSISEFTQKLDIVLHPGDVMVLYTDGISEAADQQHRLFGVEALKRIIVENYRQTAEQIKTAVLSAIEQHTASQPLYDDITLLVIKQLDLDSSEYK